LRERRRKILRLLRTKPDELATLLLDGVESSACPLPIERLRKVFEKRWKGEDGTFLGLGGFKVTGGAANDQFSTLFSTDEVLRHLMSVEKLVVQTGFLKRISCPGIPRVQNWLVSCRNGP